MNTILEYLYKNSNKFSEKYYVEQNYGKENNFEGITIKLVRKESNYIYSIITLISYDGKGYFLSPPGPIINYLQISEILYPILYKNERISNQLTLEELNTLGSKLEDEVNKIKITNDFNFDFRNYTDVDLFIEKINIYIEKYAEPFFAKWSNLEMILELIDQTSQLEFCEMVSYGAYVKPIVYKIMGRIDAYNDYMERFINYNKERAVNDPSEIFIKQQLDSSIELKETLDKI